MTDPVLHLAQVMVRAGERILLQVEEFHVAAGESVALIGPNGAGKTTLLHVAALLRRPEMGSVSLLGTRATAGTTPALRRSLSVVFQDPLLFDVRVLSNAAAGLRFQGVNRAEAEARAFAWLERFGVGHLSARKARGLSGGEAGRVALARAFATEPALLLLDEPFSALDAPTRSALLPALRGRLHETGTAAILVTHDLDEALAFSGTVALMHGGHVVACGSAPDMIARPPTRLVAKLLGVETILPVEVIQLDRDEACVALGSGGPSARVRLPRSAAAFAGKSVTLTLPAGAVRALRRGERCPAGWNCLPGIVREVQPLRSGARLLVETPAPVTALAPWDPAHGRWSVGDRAVVTFAPEAAHLIPETD